MEEKTNFGTKINWYFSGLIFVLTIFYDVANSIEPEIEEELDFFEITRVLGFLAVSIFI